MTQDQFHELTEILTTQGFSITEQDSRYVNFHKYNESEIVNIYVIINLPQPFVSFRVNGETVLDEQPGSFRELKQIINEF